MPPPPTGTAARYTGDKCAACHGNSPATGAHAAHVVGIHADDIYSGTTGKLATAGAVGTSAGHGDPAQSTTLSCNICHNTTINVALQRQEPVLQHRELPRRRPAAQRERRHHQPGGARQRQDRPGLLDAAAT